MEIMHKHRCCVCQVVWLCHGSESRCVTTKSVSVNKDGPYCHVCQNAVMTVRHAQHARLKQQALVKLIGKLWQREKPCKDQPLKKRSLSC